MTEGKYITNCFRDGKKKQVIIFLEVNRMMVLQGDFGPSSNHGEIVRELGHRSV